MMRFSVQCRAIDATRGFLAAAFLAASFPLGVVNAAPTPAPFDPMDLSPSLYLRADQGVTTSTFTPLDLNPALFLRADTGVITDDDGYVTSWVDQSGNDRDFAQTTQSKRPDTVANAWGDQPGVRFNGNGQFLETSDVSWLDATSGSVFALIRLQSYQSLPVIFSADNTSTTTNTVRLLPFENTTNGGIRIIQNNGGTADSVRGTTTNVSPGISNTIMWSSSGSAYGARVNGVAQSLTVNSGADTGDWYGDVTGLNNAVIGGVKDGNGERLFYGGEIGVLLVFNTVLTDDQTKQVENWLTRWSYAQPGATITSVTTWEDQSGGNNDFALPAGAIGPQVVNNMWGDKPALLFDGASYLSNTAPSFLDAAQGSVFALVELQSRTTDFQTVFASSDTATITHAVRLWAYRQGASPYAGTFFNDGGSGTQATGDTTIQTGSKYIMEWSSTGSAYAMSINGDPQTITMSAGTDTGDWFGDATGRDNVTIGATVDSNGVRQTFKGRIGLVLVYNTALSAGEKIQVQQWMNDWAYGGAYQSSDLTVSSPEQYQVFQRDANGVADIPISGTYSGSPTAIEARFNGGAWTTIDASPSGGAFSGMLSSQPEGQGPVEVRFTNDTTVTSGASTVGIGDVYLVAGQSNAAGRGSTNNAYYNPRLKATLFRTTGVWGDLIDPTANDALAAGSAWPIVATTLMQQGNVPVAFITTAEGGTALVDPTGDWDAGGATFTTSVDTVAASNVNAVKSVLWYQGETDAQNGVAKATYEAALIDLLDRFQAADAALASSSLVAGQIGMVHSTTDADLNAIRLAQSGAWNSDSQIYAGPVTYDIDLSDESGDSLHFKSPWDMHRFASRFSDAINSAYFGAQTTSPQLSTLVVNNARTQITATFNGRLYPQSYTANAWNVYGDGVNVDGTISSIEHTGTNAVRINLSSAATAPITVDLGYGEDGAGQVVPRGPSINQPPGAVFISNSALILPSVTTNAATGVAFPLSGTTATLNGNLSDMGEAESLTVRFQWGYAADALTNQTAGQNVTESGTFSATITGYSPDATVYFKATATNGATTVTGDTLSFGSPSAPGWFTVMRIVPIVFAIAIVMLALGGFVGAGYVAYTGIAPMKNAAMLLAVSTLVIMIGIALLGIIANLAIAPNLYGG